MTLEEEFYHIINPKNLFKNVEEVIIFINIDPNLNDLTYFLKRCEKEELYEYCEVINNKIKELNYKTSITLP